MTFGTFLTLYGVIAFCVMVAITYKEEQDPYSGRLHENTAYGIVLGLVWPFLLFMGAVMGAVKLIEKVVK